jgi:IMP dehydrogenase
MIKEITDFGGIGFVNRFQNDESRISQLSEVMGLCQNNHLVGFSVNNMDVDNKVIIKKAIDLGVKILLIDTAFGHTEIAIEYIKKLRTLVSDNIHIMTGNISSYEAYKDLMSSGSDSVRVGIGAGAACTTRVVTGFGVPVLSSIMDIYDNIKNDKINGIICDGGIVQNGDIAKAIAAGASAVMMGYKFSGHEECDGKKDNKFLLRGMASASIQVNQTTGTPPPAHMFHVEGVEAYIENKGNVKNTINQMINNLKSGISYCGCNDLSSFKKESKFIEVSSNSLKESYSRI